MLHQQKIKLLIAIGFFALFTGLSIFGYHKYLKPIRDGRNKRSEKFSLKKKYRTTFNPDFIDSVSKLNIQRKKDTVTQETP
ncbi:MAG: hypothetical protein O3B82_03680 [Bacteroidetes bacterium]|nr:hypothetical protein [Bacteroidota bacterium]